MIMKLKCETCNKMKYDTNFNFKKGWFSFWLDTSKCQECINPNMYAEVHKHFKKLLNDNERNNR